MMNIDLSSLWELANKGVITTLLGIFIGSWFTLKFVEGSKKSANKKLLLTVLYKELNKYSLPVETAINQTFQLPNREKLLYSLLTSNVLDPKKDDALINSLYELVGWVENFNVTNEYANQALLSGNRDMLQFFSNGRDRLNKHAYKEKESLVNLLRTKYNIT